MGFTTVSVLHTKTNFFLVPKKDSLLKSVQPFTAYLAQLSKSVFLRFMYFLWCMDLVNSHTKWLNKKMGVTAATHIVVNSPCTV